MSDAATQSGLLYLPEYIKSRRLFIVDGVFALVIATLMGGSYLSGYLSLIGFPTELIGVLAAFPALCGIAQVAGAFLARRVNNDKAFVIVLAALFRFGFSAMYILALILRDGWGIAAASVLFLTSCLLNAMLVPPGNSWLVSLCPFNIRGRYMGLRESAGLVATALTVVLAGRVLDYFVGRGEDGVGFVVIGVFIAVCNIVNTIALINIKRPPPAQEEGERIKMTALLLMPFRHRRFRPVIILTAIYQTGIQAGIAYWGLYLIKDLGISYSFISLITFITLIQRSVLANFWGRFADKTSWRLVTAIMLAVLGVSHLLCSVTTPGSLWLYPLSAVISAVGWSAIGLCMFNIQYQYAPEENTQMFIGVNNALSGALGFIGVLAGGAVMSAATPEGFLLAGLVIKGQQILILFSGLSTLLCAAYVYFVLKNREAA